MVRRGRAFFVLEDGALIAFAPAVNVRPVRLINGNYNLLTEGFRQTEPAHPSSRNFTTILSKSLDILCIYFLHALLSATTWLLFTLYISLHWGGSSYRTGF